MSVKIAVMYVVGFLCVSLGSSTVQLRDSVGSRRACVVKMAAVFEKSHTEEQRSVVRFFVRKRTQFN
jgi:hypothetical protein